MKKIEAKKVAKLLFKLAGKINNLNLNRKLFKKVQDTFGGHMKYFVSGGAKLDETIAKNFWTLGFKTLEGYGMTEASPLISFNPPEKVKIGTVGKAFEGIDLKIVDDEIISSSHNKSRSSGNPLQHAEMLAIQSAIESHGAAILQNAHLISSNEPCPMCMGACIWSGIRKVSYFVSQKQVADIRGWGKFISAYEIAEGDDSGIKIDGPLENNDMKKMHEIFWTTDGNSEYKYSIHLLNDKLEKSL